MVSRYRTSVGFTLIELVVVMVIIGALSVLALPRLLDTTMWRLRAFSDALQSEMQANLRRSLSQRRPIVASISASGVSFAYQAGGALGGVDCPAEATSCIAEATTRTVTFNAGNQGRSTTSTGTAMPITVSSGGYTRAFQVETETGLIYPLP